MKISKIISGETTGFATRDVPSVREKPSFTCPISSLLTGNEVLKEACLISIYNNYS